MGPPYSPTSAVGATHADPYLGSAFVFRRRPGRKASGRLHMLAAHHTESHRIPPLDLRSGGTIRPGVYGDGRGGRGLSLRVHRTVSGRIASRDGAETLGTPPRITRLTPPDWGFSVYGMETPTPRDSPRHRPSGALAQGLADACKVSKRALRPRPPGTTSRKTFARSSFRRPAGAHVRSTGVRIGTACRLRRRIRV